MSPSDSFKKASEQVKCLNQKPSNEELLRLYGLYKQATEGNIQGKRPGILNVKDRAKWDAWKKLEGQSETQAQQNYATYNSPAMKAHRAQMAGSVPQWKQHQFTQDSPYPNKPKNRDYGIPDFVSDRRRENRSAMASNNRSLGMSNADAEARARRDEAELHKKNLKYQQNRRYGYKD